MDALVDRALALGGGRGTAPSDDGYMYGRSFFDLDGHAWEVMWMDPSAVALTCRQPGRDQDVDAPRARATERSAS